MKNSKLEGGSCFEFSLSVFIFWCLEIWGDLSLLWSEENKQKIRKRIYDGNGRFIQSHLLDLGSFGDNLSKTFILHEKALEWLSSSTCP